MADREAPEIIGQADCFLGVLERVSRVAPLSKPVLIVGERGTGKELIANRLHFLSERWQRPFVKFNCAALNEELLESELFGHVSGAYTGAARARTGRFELADGGTIFIDELASMSVRLQEKLLRVIEYGEFERLGSSETIRTDVRLIAAANVDLPAVARSGKFREDLLDRLSFDVITLPPLRERLDDIALLSQKFGEGMARELRHEYFPGFAPRATQQLLDYGWPGNVRELRNVIERAVYQNPYPKRPIETLSIDPFESPYRPKRTEGTGEGGAAAGSPPPVAAATEVPDTRAPLAKGGAGEAPSSPQAAADVRAGAASDAAPLSWPLDFQETVEQLEKRLLRAAMAEARYNQRKAAERLKLSYHQFRGLLRKYQLLGDETG